MRLTVSGVACCEHSRRIGIIRKIIREFIDRVKLYLYIDIGI